MRPTTAGERAAEYLRRVPRPGERMEPFEWAELYTIKAEAFELMAAECAAGGDHEGAERARAKAGDAWTMGRRFAHQDVMARALVGTASSRSTQERVNVSQKARPAYGP